MGRLFRALLEGRRIIAQCTRDLRQILVCLAHERVEEHVLHQEGAILSYPGLVVVAVSEELDEVGEAVVARVQGSVPGSYKVYVSAAVRWDLVWAQLESLPDRIPHRGVVHATLPGMADVDQTFPFWVAFPMEVLVPSFQLGEVVFEKLFGCCLEIGRAHV